MSILCIWGLIPPKCSIQYVCEFRVTIGLFPCIIFESERVVFESKCNEMERLSSYLKLTDILNAIFRRNQSPNTENIQDYCTMMAGWAFRKLPGQCCRGNL